MAADSLLPLFHEQTAGRMADPPNDGEDFLAELLGGAAGDDLMASLLEPNTYESDQLSLPHTITMSPPPLPTSTTTLLSNIDSLTQPSVYQSPPHDGYVSDSSTLNRAHSPYSCSSHSPVDMLGNSPSSNSPNDVMITSAGGLGEDDLGILLGLSEGQLRTCAASNSSDVMINVDPEPALNGVPADSAATGSLLSSHAHKAATLVLTEEEKALLAAEGVSLPTDMPLTKQEQKHLKRVRRKIKNKLSAQESRKRKKEYVEGLEERVERSTQLNQRLSEKVGLLQSENKSLLQQVQRLQAVVAKLYPTKLQAGTLLMVLGLSFSLIYMPWLRHPSPSGSPHAVTVHSRTLLFTEADEFGNLIDPETGHILSEQGGLSPPPPYPWSYQTPAFIPSQWHARPDHFSHMPSETFLDSDIAHASLHSTRQDL